MLSGGASGVRYNRIVVSLKYWICALLLVLSSACNKAAQTKEAVQQGLFEHLQNRTGLDVKSMDINVSAVSFRENEADATVTFHPKGSTDAASAMQMKYVMEQKDGKWVVKGKSGMSQHGGQAPLQALPPGHPPTPAPDAGGAKK